MSVGRSFVVVSCCLKFASSDCVLRWARNIASASMSFANPKTINALAQGSNIERASKHL